MELSEESVEPTTVGALCHPPCRRGQEGVTDHLLAGGSFNRRKRNTDLYIARNNF